MQFFLFTINCFLEFDRSMFNSIDHSTIIESLLFAIWPIFIQRRSNYLYNLIPINK